MLNSLLNLEGFGSDTASVMESFDFALLYKYSCSFGMMFYAMSSLLNEPMMEVRVMPSIEDFKGIALDLLNSVMDSVLDGSYDGLPVNRFGFSCGFDGVNYYLIFTGYECK